MSRHLEWLLFREVGTGLSNAGNSKELVQVLLDAVDEGTSRKTNHSQQLPSIQPSLERYSMCVALHVRLLQDARVH
ncbi:hypothetical protein PIIN_11550 [Serendipita indica DSM 11827]|uniref:Uncharacterized protein n=1 Tax=Serendipita indica (strain DSM 11827) TaxID=1109443 RepID=G4U1Y0_SERID|nr:hypothetical protein PIIN_11550 [Serendipita indica DSM 11827]